MTATVLSLVLAGPLQSWGSSSRFVRRETDGVPTKSGFLGLLAACAGRRRNDSIEDLLSLRMAVRIETPGTRIRDFHTMSRGILPDPRLPTAKGEWRAAEKSTLISHRFYLSDACFTVFCAGDRTLLEALAEAIVNPVYAPALGRRSCPPGRPLIPVLVDDDLEHVVCNSRWQASPHHQRQHHQANVALRYVIDDLAGPMSVCDVPMVRTPEGRTFGWRRVREGLATIPTDPAVINDSARTATHDPFALL